LEPYPLIGDGDITRWYPWWCGSTSTANDLKGDRIAYRRAPRRRRIEKGATVTRVCGFPLNGSEEIVGHGYRHRDAEPYELAFFHAHGDCGDLG